MILSCRAPIDEGSKKVVVINDDVTTVDGLAVDWLYNHIYWTNTDLNTIEVCTSTVVFKIIVSSNHVRLLLFELCKY